MKHESECNRLMKKNAIEDAAFHTFKPPVYKNLRRKITLSSTEDAQFLEGLKTLIPRLLSRKYINAEIQGRLKSLYSTHCKVNSTGKNFETISDRIGLRIIVQTVPECYRVLDILHSHFQPIPNRYKNYIKLQKDNGYQSLHTCVYSLQSIPFKPIEFQIRTQSMHQVAEYGIVSHCRYKWQTQSIAGNAPS